MHSLLPQHGQVSCTRCFCDSSKREWEGTGRFSWQLLHGPGAWGSQDPIILLLGFSKGETQLNAVANCAFEDVPFKDMRPNIEQVLRRLALLPMNVFLSQLIVKSERDFAFGSMLRCSIGKWDVERRKFIRSGNKMLTDCVSDPPSAQLLLNCTTQFQTMLPERLRLVLLMGNEHKYVAGCYETLRQVRPGLRLLPPVHWKGKEHHVAYTDGSVVWCHFPHAAGQAFSHLKNWVETDNTLQSAKRESALCAVELAGVRQHLRW